MRAGSIRFRLWSAAAVSLVLALAIAGFGLSYLFERHVERRVERELTLELYQLIGTTALVGDQFLTSPAPTDPRFAVPLSGYYWQVEDLSTGALTRSRSLWDETLVLPTEGTKDGSLHTREIPGPAGSNLIAVERVIIDASGRSFRAVVAEDYRTVAVSVTEYAGELAPAVVLLGLVLIAANFIQISIGLRPLESLRKTVHDVLAGHRSRLKVVAPTEVQPLADEIDRLLGTQERALQRARSRAADLAHGLKTPLQVLASDIRALREKGDTAVADEIEKSSAAIRRHVDRELARARLAPGTVFVSDCSVAAVVRDVVAVVRRTPRGATLSYSIEVEDDLRACIDIGDLTEALGSLIENATRFAKSEVRVEGHSIGSDTLIVVADDGPGIPDAEKPAALLRGVRLDAGEGTGLGLSIVSDIVVAYGGRLELADGGPGLRVTVALPCRTPLLELNVLAQVPR